MAGKGKWAQGIEPRHFNWVIKDQLAVCERPGGFGANHRKVRRSEEIIWIREQGFDFVISLSPGPNNLHSYDELGVRWKHWPLPASDEVPRYLNQSYNELRRLLTERRKLILHHDELSDRLTGFLAGYLVWNAMVPEIPRATSMIEHIVGRQMGADGREIVVEAGLLLEARRAAQVDALNQMITPPSDPLSDVTSLPDVDGDGSDGSPASDG